MTFHQKDSNAWFTLVPLNKHGVWNYTWLDKTFKGTIVNQTLPSFHGGKRLKIMHTVSLGQSKGTYFPED